jgi:uracil-DNA glycosylase
VLVWVYYSVQILLYGAEVTEAYAKRLGKDIKRPKKQKRWTARNDVPFVQLHHPSGTQTKWKKDRRDLWEDYAGIEGGSLREQ